MALIVNSVRTDFLNSPKPMSQRLKSVSVFVALLCCFAVFKLLTHALVLSSFSQMIVDAELDHEDRLELFASPHARLQDYELVITSGTMAVWRWAQAI